MPYIELNERTKFANLIKDVLGILSDTNDTIYIKGEYFGFFVNRVAKRFMAHPDYTQNSFHSAFFNESKKKTLINSADSIAAMLNRSDPISASGDLNYAISAVLWGYLGQAKGSANAGYGVRTYFKSFVEKVRDSLETVNSGSQKDATMAYRRYLITRSVLNDVVIETFRRHTAVYEDEKLGRNGDIWLGGQLYLPKEIEE